jgi:hypothetical protein
MKTFQALDNSSTISSNPLNVLFDKHLCFSHCHTYSIGFNSGELNKVGALLMSHYQKVSLYQVYANQHHPL